MKKGAKILAWLLTLNLLFTLLPAGLAEAGEQDVIQEAQTLVLADEATEADEAAPLLALAHEEAADALAGTDGDSGADDNAEPNDSEETPGQLPEGEDATDGETTGGDATPTEGEADETAGDEPVIETYVLEPYIVYTDDTSADNDELFAAYAQKKLDAARGRRLLRAAKKAGWAGLAGSPADQAIYNLIAPELPSIAAGSRASTEFSIAADALGVKTSWTEAELEGVEGDSNFNKAGQLFLSSFDAKKVANALMADYPYELYWYDKTGTGGFATKNVALSSSYKDGVTTYSVTGNITFAMAVAAEYSATGGTKTYTIDTAKAASVQSAVTKAQAIVAANAGKSDYEKLLAYKDAICDLVSYNSGAAGGGTAYGNPWQLIYVFDGDESTNVVCEGYSKAFQYLCDLSDFTDATCYTVSGQMTGGTGAGPHMWNIVTIGGKNYLVDVTNCDAGTIGAPDKLFLKGYDEHPADDTYVVNGVTYIYGDSTLALYGDDDLEVSGEYTVTVTAWTNLGEALTGSGATANPASATKGTMIALNTNFLFDYNGRHMMFDHWEDANTGAPVDIERAALADGASFVMPDRPVEIRAIYREGITLHVLAGNGETGRVESVGAVPPATCRFQVYSDSMGVGFANQLEDAYVGETFTIKAETDAGSVFDHWAVETGEAEIKDAASAETTVTLKKSVAGIVAVYAHFRPLPTYDVTVTTNLPEALAAQANASASANPAREGDKVTLTTPMGLSGEDGFYLFQKWECVSGGAEILNAISERYASFTMPAGPVKVQAVYARVHNVSVTSEGNGGNETHAQATPALDVAAGREVKLTADQYVGSEDEKYRFKEWQVVSGDVTLVNPTSADGASFTMPDGPVEVKAVFGRMYQLDIGVNGPGTVSPADANDRWVAEGEKVVLSAEPAEGYGLSSWYIPESYTVIYDQAVLEYTVDPYDAHENIITITAYFAPLYSITVTADPSAGGTATADRAQAAQYNTVTLTAKPAEGYRFKEWKRVSGYVIAARITPDPSDPLKATFMMDWSDVEIQAVFEPLPTYPVTITGEHGAASANPASARSGQTVALTATPDAGYAFAGWTVVSGGVTLVNPTSADAASFTMGDQAVEIQAAFACAHSSLTPVAAVAATCAAPGNIAYYKCDNADCGKLFSDAAATKEIALEATVLPVDPDAHAWDSGAVTTAPSCTAAGVKTFTCQNDKGHTRTEPVDALGHNMSKTAAVAAKCEADGNIEYWTCERCKLLFSDAAGKTQITQAETVVKATGHQWDSGAVTTAPTCTAAGVKTYTCKNDAKHTYTEPIVALGHKLTETAAVAAKCEAGGNIAYWTCATCNKLFSDAEGTKEITQAETVIKATGHSWGDWTETVPATEEAEGVETRTCKNDASHTETRTIPKLNHVHKLTEVAAVAAKCETDGNIAYYQCSGCGRYFRDAAGANEINAEDTVVKALGHAWGEWETGTAATCEQAGEEVRACKNDATHTEKREIPALGHDWGEWTETVPATEEAKGVETRVCKNDPAHTETRAIPRQAHTLVRIEAVPAACETPGNIEYYTCAGCGKRFRDAEGLEEITLAETVLRALGHDYAAEVTEEATCTEDGVRTYTCKNDASHSYTEVIPAKGHTLREVPAAPATCETDGNPACYDCVVCGKRFADGSASRELTRAEYILPATGHDWGDWTETTPATEDSEGVETRVCRNDPSHTETRTIPRLGHTHRLEPVAAVAPTCTDAGSEACYRCAGCGLLFRDSAGAEEIAAPDAIAAPGHAWGAWETAKPATCGEDGLQTRACARCEEQEALLIPATGAHAWGEWTIIQPATCVEAGEQTHTCAICGASETEAIPANEIHAWGEWTITQPATCGKAGEQTRACAICGATETEAIPANEAHAWGEWTITQAATCGKAGEQTRACAVCGATETEAIPATGAHAWGKPVVRTVPTAGGDGELESACAVCGETRKIAIPALEKRYYIAEGDNGAYYKQDKAAPRVVVKATEDDARTFERFVSLYVDGQIVPQSDYTAEAGSAVITLKPEFANTLSTGAHTLTAVFEDGYAEAKLTVLARGASEEKPDDKQEERGASGGTSASGAPQTGDRGNLILWLVLTLAALAGCCAVLIYDRRKKAGK